MIEAIAVFLAIFVPYAIIRVITGGEEGPDPSDLQGGAP